MTKKKLFVLLGAGSSVEQGFPSTSDLNTEVAEWARRHVASKHRIYTEEAKIAYSIDYYNLLWENRERYSLGASGEPEPIFTPRTEPNYERVLGDLHLFMNAVLRKPFGDPILRWATHADVFESFPVKPDLGAPHDIQADKNFQAAEAQLGAILRQLTVRLRRDSAAFESFLAAEPGRLRFQPYRKLFDDIGTEFDLGIYNLNYDTCALKALADPFVGFDRSSGIFLPSEVLRRPEWGFVYHLHGSVHFRIRQDSNLKENDNYGQKITWCPELTGPSGWTDVGHLTTKTDGKRMLLSTFVAGGWKLDQLQEEPFLTFYSGLARHIHEADAIMIAGYGFGDPHINAILRNVLWSKAIRSVRPPVLVIDLDQRPLARRPLSFAEPMEVTLRTSYVSFRDKSHRSEKNPGKLPAQITPNEFERPIEKEHSVPVALWSWGFCSASSQSEVIVRWLAGDRSVL